MPRHSTAAFTLLELLSVIAIIAVLVAAATFFTVSYVNYAQNNSDKQTLTVLNDALTRYKTEGGGVNALTLGAPIGHIISQLQTAVTWSGISHQFLQSGVTYPARSLIATGTGAQYQFNQYNTYKATTIGVGVPSSQYQYGSGVAYATNNGTGGYAINVTTSSGFFAKKNGGSGTTNKYASGASLGAASQPSITIWSCASLTDSTPSGNITAITCANGIQLTTLDVSGCTGLTSLACGNNVLTTLNLGKLPNLSSLNCAADHLTSLNVGGCTGLTSLTCTSNNLTSLDVSGCTSLQTLQCISNPITSLNIGHLPSLMTLDCTACSLTSLDASGCHSLGTLTCTANGNLASLNVSGCPNLNNLNCQYCSLGPITLGGHTPSTFVYTPQNGTTPTLQ